jgi:hypothetical protein
MKALLGASADPNLGDSKPVFEVLDRVKRSGNLEMLTAFLATAVKKIDIHCKINRTGISVLEYATAMGMSEAINMLNEYHQRLIVRSKEPD